MGHRARNFIVALIAAALFASALGLGSPSSATAARSTAVPDPRFAEYNQDTDQFHLLWRGAVEPPPFGGETPSIGEIFNPANWGTILDGLGGGVQTRTERHSGFCRNIWETYSSARVKTGTAGAHPRLNWETFYRPETQFVRYLHNHYLGSHASCATMREDLARMQQGRDRGEWNEMVYRICDYRDPADNRPYAIKRATGVKKQQLERFCALVGAGPVDYERLRHSYQVADNVSQYCDINSLVGYYRELVAHRIEVEDINYDMEEFQAALGSEQDDNRRPHWPRMVSPEAVVAVYNTYFASVASGQLRGVATNLSRQPSVRNFVCSKPGRFVAEPSTSSLDALSEQDLVIRDFFDLQAGEPFGSDQIANEFFQGLIEPGTNIGNMWQLFVGITRAPQCTNITLPFKWGNGTWDNEAFGVRCDRGSGGWNTLDEFFNPEPPPTAYLHVRSVAGNDPNPVAGVFGAGGTNPARFLISQQRVYLDDVQLRAIPYFNAWEERPEADQVHILRTTEPAGWEAGYTICRDRAELYTNLTELPACHAVEPTWDNALFFGQLPNAHVSIWFHFRPRPGTPSTVPPTTVPPTTVPPTTVPPTTVPPRVGIVAGYKLDHTGSSANPAIRNVTVSATGVGGGSDSGQPYDFTALAPGSHTISVVPPAGWEAWSVICHDSASCMNNPRTKSNSRTVTVVANQQINLWWHFTPIPQTPGSIRGFKQIGKNDGSRIESTIAGHKHNVVTQPVYINGVNRGTMNGFDFANLAPGDYTVRVGVPAGWQVGYTKCAPGLANCHSATPTPGNTATVTVASGKFTEIWWHYTPLPSNLWCEIDGRRAANFDRHVGAGAVNKFTVTFRAGGGSVTSFYAYVGGDKPRIPGTTTRVENHGMPNPGQWGGIYKLAGDDPTKVTVIAQGPGNNPVMCTVRILTP